MRGTRGSTRSRLRTAPWDRNELWRRAQAVPSLDLRFAEDKSLVDHISGQNLITFTRASSATFVGSNGVLQTAVTNAPRFDHNPTTGESLGLLVEEQRTNLLVRSEEFENAYWFKSAATITSNATTAPNGTTTADKLVETAVSTEHIAAVLSMGLASNVYTVSVFAKAAERTQISIFLDTGITRRTQYFNLSTGTLGTNSGGLTSSIQAFADGWYRCSVTLNAAETLLNVVYTTALSGSNNYLGNASSGAFLWGAQLEAGAFPTSYIPTTTAAVTRAADIASITGSNFSSWYRQDEGTFYGDASTPFAVTAFPTIADSRSGTDIIQLGFNTESLAVQFVQVGGATQSILYPTGLTGVRRRRIASAMQANNFGIAVNGGAIFSDNSGSMPSSLTSLTIGQRSGGADALNGHIRRLTYFPQRLYTLQSLTS